MRVHQPARAGPREDQPASGSDAAMHDVPLPTQDIRVTNWPRDFYPVDANGGTVHTSQRGLRSGIVFASAVAPVPFTVFYFQNFSSLNDYFTETKRTPTDTVGGTWPELGYAPPTGDDCVLAKAREIVVSDAFVSLSATAPQSECAIAALYLDKCAEVYSLLEKPSTEYHSWPERAAKALRDLSFSPLCTYVCQGRRYLMPYVADETKPPESMVQLTVALNAGEYDEWLEEKNALSSVLRNNAASFFNEDVGSIVRWLPGEAFEDGQAEDNMNHEAMDSWYLHHSLFNVFRVARAGDSEAKDIFKKSMPYLIRVARRFDYRWPIFFNLRTVEAVKRDLTNLCAPTESVRFLEPTEWGRFKNGAGTPPIRTSLGWLSVFHGVDTIDGPDGPTLLYSAGILINDLYSPHRVAYCSPAPVLVPETTAERFGAVNDVVFPTGIDPIDDCAFDVYYGAADAKISRARFTLQGPY